MTKIKTFGATTISIHVWANVGKQFMPNTDTL